MKKPKPLDSSVEWDAGNALSYFAYWRSCLAVLWKRRRNKLTLSLACDCGWRHHFTMSEHLNWDVPHMIVCQECGDHYNTLGGTITEVYRRSGLTDEQRADRLAARVWDVPAKKRDAH